MHLVQTLIFFTLPFTTALTFWILGRKTRLVTRCEWLTLRPAEGLLPQTAHTFDMFELLESFSRSNTTNYMQTRYTTTKYSFVQTR